MYLMLNLVTLMLPIAQMLENPLRPTELVLMTIGKGHFPAYLFILSFFLDLVLHWVVTLSLFLPKGQSAGVVSTLCKFCFSAADAAHFC